jgi:epoxyqueuosine reductase
MLSDLTVRLKEKAYSLGFNTAGVVPAAPSPRLNAYLKWIDQGMHGEMDYMARPDRVARRQNPSVILSGLQSIVCVGLEYFSTAIPDEIINDPSRGRISNYAWNLDYHELMWPRLHEMAAWLKEASGTAVSSRVYVDTGAILERDHAKAAGLGFTGKNSMLIDPRRGSWSFLGELLTTLSLDYDPLVTQMPNCGSCQSCLDACPTEAFPEPYVLDARRCISYLTIELKGWIPRQLRPLMGNWIYGCDICQIVCPFNRFAQPGDDASFEATDWDAVAPPLLDLLAMDEGRFAERFANSPTKRIRRRRLVRNACVAAGNWGSERALPLLVRLLSDPEPLIRGHAAWALRQIAGRDAEKAVAAAAERWTDRTARREMLVV